MKILVFPLFQFPMGHHKVADTVNKQVLRQYPDATIKVVDLLSYCNKHLEKFTASIYLTCIKKNPAIYRTIFNSFILNKKQARRKSKFQFSSRYFEHKMQKLIEEEAPTLIIFTHSFPSGIVGNLIKKKRIPLIPTINIYTDFFINDVWAKEQVDYHFVPHQEAKQALVNNHQIDEQHIFVTGIPVDSSFKSPISNKTRPMQHILVAGGNTGLLDNGELVKMVQAHKELQFTVLCGSNVQLYRSLTEQAYPNVRAFTYIDSFKKINDLYTNVDVILTKPGGVTISEAIKKKIPIFVQNYLPGQEEINLNYLVENGLAMHLQTPNASDSPFSNEELITSMKLKMTQYSAGISCSLFDALQNVFTNEFANEVKV